MTTADRPLILAASRSGVQLRELVAEDADAYVALLHKNVQHLTAHGDYRDEVALTVAQVRAGFADLTPLPVRFGIVLDGALVGRADLVPVDPPRFGLGYWLASEATGRGYATIAVGTLIEHARETLAATDVYAGVTYGNDRSEALLRRLAFSPVAEFETYRRWHRSLNP